MSLGSRFWPAVLFTVLASNSTRAADWALNPPGGDSAIEITVKVQPFSVRRYRVQTNARPYVHLKRSIRASEINYFVDEVGRGVLSGNLRQQLNFYAICRREPGEMVCIEMFYHVDMQSDYAEMIADIARSFDHEGYR